MLSDQEKQEDEIFALQNILHSNEFRWNKKSNIECSFSINCNLTDEIILIKHNISNENKRKELYIKHLPPIRFYVQLPKTYPSLCAPQFHLAINWLPPWQISLVCQKLDELWKENEFNEILFTWLDFLKNELLWYLNFKDTLDISYLYYLFQNPHDVNLLELLKWTDNRVVYGGLYLNPIEKLLDYNNLGELIKFETSFHECHICFGTYPGKICININICNHIFCKTCTLQYLTIKINERNVCNLKCPAFGCKAILKYNQIKEICTTDIIEKYEKCLMELKLVKNKNIVYCPRKKCQSPVSVKDGENLASCQRCEYNFCAYCFKVYHGVMACDMNSEQKLKLIQEYEKGGKIIKQFLEKKYGKNQIRQIIEKELTNDYLKQSTKVCPTCGILTVKIKGCNLLNCSHCHTNFCWLCNSKILSEDAYDHFKFTKKGPCRGRLFEGVDESQIDDEIDDYDIDLEFNMFENVG